MGRFVRAVVPALAFAGALLVAMRPPMRLREKGWQGDRALARFSDVSSLGGGPAGDQLGLVGRLHDIGHEGRDGARLQGEQPQVQLQPGRIGPDVHHSGHIVQLSTVHGVAGQGDRPLEIAIRLWPLRVWLLSRSKLTSD